jgi:TolB-like protein/cytochrome c-type biogenesis protein CcmH/NrfG
MTSAQPREIVSFGPFSLVVSERLLTKNKTPVELGARALDILIALVSRPNEPISKRDLMAQVWPDVTVEEISLRFQMTGLRKVLGDGKGGGRYITTLPGRGYCFVAPITRSSAPHDVVPMPAMRDQARHPPRLVVSGQALPLPDRPAIAVLAFTNMTGDPAEDYFSDGISEDIITALSKLRWFFVIARNSSFIYKGKAVHIKQVGDELGVGYVLEGSVRKNDERVRITAQLNDVTTGSHIWAERYDRSLTDVFAVQDEITEAIVTAIEPQLYSAENFRARRKPPDSMGAWDLVMRALSHYWRTTPHDNLMAQALLQKAVTIDPNYGQALGLLAASYVFGVHMGWTDMAMVIPIAERTALEAIRADSEDPWAHFALGRVYLFTRRFDESLAELELALHLNPNFSFAYASYALALCYCGRWQEGDSAARRALRLSPRDPFSAVYYGTAAYAQFVGRHYDEAIRLAREAVRHRSDLVAARRVLVAAAGMAGKDDIAKAALQELRRAQPNVSLAWISNSLPIKDEWEREHYLEGFRRAGLD